MLGFSVEDVNANSDSLEEVEQIIFFWSTSSNSILLPTVDFKNFGAQLSYFQSLRKKNAY